VVIYREAFYHYRNHRNNEKSQEYAWLQQSLKMRAASFCYRWCEWA